MDEKAENNGLEEESRKTSPTSDPEASSDEEKASTVFKDAPKTSEDLAKHKQQFQSGNMDVKDNKAENLMIVQNAVIYGGTSFGGRGVREEPGTSATVGKEYDLSDAQQFSEFGETLKAGEHFAVAVILCVFEYVELDDLQDLKSKLLAELPKITDEEGKEIGGNQNAYLSVNSLIKMIKGKMFLTENDEKCIGLGESRPAALKNLWQQFPSLRDHIARWLLNVSGSFEYRTNFDAAQITSAFANIFKLDFSAAATQFFQRLYSNPDQYWLLGFIALELYNDPAYRSKILPYLIKWAESSSPWLWKSAVYVYAKIKNGEEDGEFDKKAAHAVAVHCNFLGYGDMENDNLPYIGILLIGSERLRTLVASLLGDLVAHTHHYGKKRLVCLWYLELLRYGYYFVSAQTTALPLVACDKKRQLEKLFPLLGVLLARYDTRRLLFVTLESYFKEIAGYEVEKPVRNHIKAYLQTLAISDIRYRSDILLFLKDCNCKLSDELVEFFDHSVLESQ